jgi:hypothetical protein
MFCNETVPLARMGKEVFTNNESFKAEIEVAHFGSVPIKKAEILCNISSPESDTLLKETLKKDEIAIGNSISLGTITFNLTNVSKAQKLTLSVSIKDTPFKNSWDFWVYPAKQDINAGSVLITDKLDKNTEAALKRGGSVLLLTHGKVGKDKGARVSIGFSSIFWNTAWTNNQPPHTLGILCNPEHPVFSDFPTEYHSNWQWWDPVSHSQTMILDGFPANLKPLIQPIDTWFSNRRLSLVFETRTGHGKLMVCSIDMKNKIDERPVSKQLLISLLKYMNSQSFNPEIEVGMSKIQGLLAD